MTRNQFEMTDYERGYAAAIADARKAVEALQPNPLHVEVNRAAAAIDALAV